MEFNTALLHKNFSGDKASGSTMTPIYQVSAFSHSSAEQLEKVFNNKAPGYAYSRIGNPTVTSFEARIAALKTVQVLLRVRQVWQQLQWHFLIYWSPVTK